MFSILRSITAIAACASYCIAQTTAELRRPLDALPIQPQERPIPVVKEIDGLLLRLYEERDAVGMSVAITKNGKLLYARGFGYADLSLKTPVEPTTRFRIASISKSITAVAVLQLIQQRKLQLDDPAVSYLQLDPMNYEGSEPDKRLQTVTIRQLLNQTAGWDRDASFDPMSAATRGKVRQILGIEKESLRPKHIVRYMLTQPLDFDPGTQYSYSNFGYCVLGRIIESVTNQSYEDYVIQNVLLPLGITSMQIGKQDSASNEATYYQRAVLDGESKGVFMQVKGSLAPHIYESHGGWIASAVDLARFACAFDNPRNCKILSSNAIQAMALQPPGRVGFENGNARSNYYGLGWNVAKKHDGMSLSHSGSLLGSSAGLVRRHDGYSWVILFNLRKSDSEVGATPTLQKSADLLNASRLSSRFDLFQSTYRTNLKRPRR